MEEAALCPSTAAWYRWDFPIPVYHVIFYVQLVTIWYHISRRFAIPFFT